MSVWPYILVQDHLADFHERKVTVRPDFGDIQQRPTVCLGYFWLHDLDVQFPSWKMTSLNRFP